MFRFLNKFRKSESSMVNFQKARDRMVETQLVARGITDQRVLEAMRKVPRHMFVDEALQDQAYNDHPIPIGDKQIRECWRQCARFLAICSLTKLCKTKRIMTTRYR